MLEEITAKGIKPGTLVGELPDPQAGAHDAAAAAAAAQAKADRAGSGTGVYRAGGPTTIFGGSGLGPYSDGPHNAVRKSMLNREGLTEENWMYVAAQRTGEAGVEWALVARDALRSVSVDGRGVEERAPEEEGVDVANKSGKAGKRQVRTEWGNQALGVYEPHTGLIHCTSPHCERQIIFPSHVDSTFRRPRRYATDPMSMDRDARL